MSHKNQRTEGFTDTPRLSKPGAFRTPKEERGPNGWAEPPLSRMGPEQFTIVFILFIYYLFDCVGYLSSSMRVSVGFQ